MLEVSSRKKLLLSLNNKSLAETIFELLADDDPDFQTDLNCEFDLLLSTKHIAAYIEATRYIGPRDRVPKASDLLDLVLNNYDDARFRQNARMSRSAFQRVSKLISGHRIFANKSNLSQAPVEKQLLVALYRFGCDGSAASTHFVAQRFGIAEGTADLYNFRFSASIILSFISSRLSSISCRRRSISCFCSSRVCS